MKKMLFSLMATALIVFTFSSCEKDLYEDGLLTSSREINVRKISLKDIEKSVLTKINGEITKVKNMKYETTSKGNRIEYNSELDIYIDTDNGNVVTVDGKNFYTFPMFKDDDNKIENVLFVDNGTGEMDTYLIKYDITPQEFENLTSEQVQNIDAEYQKVFWSGGEQVCFTWTTTTTVYPNCPYPGGLHSNGAQCEAEVHVNSTTLCTFVEVFGQGDSLGEGGGGAGVGGDTSGGGTTGGSSSGNTIHTGIGTSPELVKMKDFVKSLPDNLEIWYNENESSHESIQDYLEENNFSDQSKELVKNVIGMSLENNVELDFNIDEDNVQTITSLNDFESLIQSIKTETNDDDLGDSNIIGDQIFATKTIDITPIHELVVEVVCNTNPFSLDNNGSTSFLGNIVIGNSWVQNSMSVTSSSVTSSPQYAEITLVGYILVGVSFEGLEFGVKQRKKIKFLINKTTGEICCTTTENLN